MSVEQGGSSPEGEQEVSLESLQSELKNLEADIEESWRSIEAMRKSFLGQADPSRTKLFTDEIAQHVRVMETEATKLRELIQKQQ